MYYTFQNLISAITITIRILLCNPVYDLQIFIHITKYAKIYLNKGIHHATEISSFGIYVNK